MKLRVLVDNNTYIDQYYLGEPGLSFYIEEGELRILFDTGYSDALIMNARNMGIDLENITHVVLSHGHDDHTRGLRFLCEEKQLSSVKVIAHPECFTPRWDEGVYCGSPFGLGEMKERFSLHLSAGPVFLTPNLCFLGEIPVTQDFEPRLGLGETETEEGVRIADRLLDDTALVYRAEDGLAIITGCSHSGICNIISYACEVMEEQRVSLIIGGFHLLKTDERLERTISFLKAQYEEHPYRFYPCHCVSLDAKIRMASELPVMEVGVGLELEL